jgi:hypothetical protein
MTENDKWHGGGAQTVECVFECISSPRTLLGHVTPSLNVPLLLLLLQKGHSSSRHPAVFHKYIGVNRKEVSIPQGKLYFTSKELWVKSKP